MRMLLEQCGKEFAGVLGVPGAPETRRRAHLAAPDQADLASLRIVVRKVPLPLAVRSTRIFSPPWATATLARPVAARGRCARCRSTSVQRLPVPARKSSGHLP